MTGRTGNSSFHISKKDNGNVSIRPADVSSNTDPLTLSMAIPAIKDKKTCMIRIRIDDGYGIGLTVKDTSDDSLIDFCGFPGNDMKYCDLFVPVESKPRHVSMSINGIGKNKEIEDLELWYY